MSTLLGNFYVHLAKKMLSFCLIKIKLLSFRQLLYPVQSGVGSFTLVVVATNVYLPCHSFLVNFLTSFPKDVCFPSISYHLGYSQGFGRLFLLGAE